MCHDIFFCFKHADFFSSKISILKFRTVMLQSTEIVFLSAMFLYFARCRLYLRLNVRDFEQTQKIEL